MRKVFILIALLLFCTFTVKSQTQEAGKEPSAYVSDIRFIGNKAISSEELRQVMSTTKPRSFLGLGLFGGTQKPFNSADFAKDIFLIKKLYAYKGYLGATVDYSITRKRDNRQLDLKIFVREEEPSRIDSLTYRGLEKIPDELATEYLSKKQLKLKSIFSVEQLVEERDRTLTFFREHGFAFIHEDSIRIKVDTVGTHAGIRFSINLPERLKYGSIHAVVQPPTTASNVRPKTTTFTQEQINGKILGEQHLSTKLITSAIAFRPGNFTRKSLEQRTLQNFGTTNIFSSMYITQDSVRAGELYTTVNLEAAPRQQIAPKIVLDNRYGPPFIGTSLAYENKNLFGGAEQFRASTEYGSQLSSDNRVLERLDEHQYSKVIPYEFNVKSSIIMPVLKKNGNFYSATVEYAATQQPVLLSSKNGLVRGTYSARLSPSSRLNFDFFEVEWVNKDSLNGFKQLFKTDLAQNIKVDPTNEGRVSAAIDSLMSTHLNQSFRLRLNSTNRKNPFPEETTWNADLMLEEAGSLAWLVDTYIDKKQYPGFTDKEPQIFGITYSQYVKLDTGLSYAKNITPHHQLAGKVRVGWMMPYGKAETTPEERRFYAGGANGMRGWLFNTLGPGGSTSKAASNFGADIKLELNLEYRLKLFKLFNQSSGITFFTDVGNIWDRTSTYALTPTSLRRDFAMDAGAGLRIGSPIGPFRFDFAYKLHDPAEADRWRFSNLSLSNCTFNFGIGEAF